MSIFHGCPSYRVLGSLPYRGIQQHRSTMQRCPSNIFIQGCLPSYRAVHHNLRILAAKWSLYMAKRRRQNKLRPRLFALLYLYCFIWFWISLHLKDQFPIVSTVLLYMSFFTDSGIFRDPTNLNSRVTVVVLYFNLYSVPVVIQFYPCYKIYSTLF